MNKTLSYLKVHLPVIAGITLVAVNGLIDANTFTLSAHVTGVINALLAALGLGVLHYRQQKK